MLVKTSYFPNWKADGADGPWRVTPNLMVVVPTSNHVELHYGWTGVDLLGWGITLIGVAGVFWFWRKGPLDLPPEPPRRPRRPRRSRDESAPDGGAVSAFDPAAVILGGDAGDVDERPPPPSE